MRENFQSHSAPLGETIPADNPHSVSTSMPTLKDVSMLYHDFDPDAWQRLQTTYPRFGEHPFVRAALQDAIQADVQDVGRTTVALCSPTAAERLECYVRSPEDMKEIRVHEADEMTFMSFLPKDKDSLDIVRTAMKITGGVVSSRRAEDYLVKRGLLTKPFNEIANHTTDDYETVEHSIVQSLQQVYGPTKPNIVLANSGMSAILGTIDALGQIRNKGRKAGQPRDMWIRVGNLYRDTNDIIQNDPSLAMPRVVRHVDDISKLKELVETHDEHVVGVLTEAVTNPLLEVPDIERIKHVIGDIPLVVDVSSAGSLLVDAFPHADVVIESLTKFASGHGDLMMGSVAVNPLGRYSFDLDDTLPAVIEQPYIRDMQRLAYELGNWRYRASKIGKNVVALAEFFENHNKIKQIRWTGLESVGNRYDKIARKSLAHNGLLHAGLITIQIKRNLRPTYDALDLSKGASFGTYFTLNTPYVQIVHANSISEEYTRRILENETGLNPRMLRVSVGTEDPELLKAKYADALAA